MSDEKKISLAEKRQLHRERRRRRAALAAEESGPKETPEVTIRLANDPLRLGKADSDEFEPLLTPDYAAKDFEGRRPHRALVVKLRKALALQVLLAYHDLILILGTRTAALDKLTDIVPLDIKTLLSEGRKELPKATAVETEEQLVAWSEHMYAILKSGGVRIPQDLRSTRTEATLSPIRLLSTAYMRAQTIIGAFDEAQRQAARRKRVKEPNGPVSELDAGSVKLIESAFNRYHPDLDVGKLWELAIYSDINPAALWPQHIKRFCELFEIARFVGRVDLGGRARLAHEHAGLAENVVRGDFRSNDGDWTLLAAATREKILLHFRLGDFLDALARAGSSGCALVAERGTRALTVEVGGGPPENETRRIWAERFLAWIRSLVPGTKSDG